VGFSTPVLGGRLGVSGTVESAGPAALHPLRFGFGGRGNSVRRYCAGLAKDALVHRHLAVVGVLRPTLAGSGRPFYGIDRMWWRLIALAELVGLDEVLGPGALLVNVRLVGERRVVLMIRFARTTPCANAGRAIAVPDRIEVRPEADESTHSGSIERLAASVALRTLSVSSPDSLTQLTCPQTFLQDRCDDSPKLRHYPEVDRRLQDRLEQQSRIDAKPCVISADRDEVAHALARNSLGAQLLREERPRERIVDSRNIHDRER
jgi:hypothetical protein